MPELGTYGSVRGAPSDGRPYRDWPPIDRPRHPLLQVIITNGFHRHGLIGYRTTLEETKRRTGETP